MSVVALPPHPTERRSGAEGVDADCCITFVFGVLRGCGGTGRGAVEEEEGGPRALSVLGMWGSSHCWGDGAELGMLACNFPKGLLRSCLSVS